MRSHFVVACASLVLLACGDNGGGQVTPDARHPDSRMIDAAGETCEYTEMSDATNDDLFSNTGVPETTNLSFTSTKITFCGKIDNTHFDSGQMLLDVDSYKVHVPNAGGAKLSLTGTGVESLAHVGIEIYDSVSGTDATGDFIGTHAATAAELVPGDYIVTVTSFHNAAPTTPIAYRLTLSPDDPATRCPHLTTTASYTEANDGITADGNDVYEVRYGTATPKRKLTDSLTDAPEDTSTAFTVAPAMNYRVTGVNSLPTVAPIDWMDSFQDRDTYAIKTGATTNEMSLRLNWPGTTMDMDVLVFRATDIVDIADGYLNAKMEPEFVTFAVEPNSTYWVFVGADDSSTGQPINYDLTVCGATFTP